MEWNEATWSGVINSNYMSLCNNSEIEKLVTTRNQTQKYCITCDMLACSPLSYKGRWRTFGMATHSGSLKNLTMVLLCTTMIRAASHKCVICYPGTSSGTWITCWLGGRKSIRPVKNWVVGCWHGYVSRSRCRFAYGPADATATHYPLLSKSRLILPSWFYLSGAGSLG